MAAVRLQEYDLVALLVDLPEYGLTTGDLGAVVHCYPHAAAYEGEFLDASGKTKAVATLEAHQILKLNWVPATIP